jgi:hypothetical protein
MNKKSQTNFVGTIIAISWDQNDHPKKFSLYTDRDEDIIIEDQNEIRRFTPFLNKRVKLTGRITSSLRDERKIRVYDFSLIRKEEKDIFDFKKIYYSLDHPRVA